MGVSYQKRIKACRDKKKGEASGRVMGWGEKFRWPPRKSH